MKLPKWKRRTHLILTDIAAQKMGIPEDSRRILAMHTLEPDAWTVFQMPAHYMPFAAFIAARAAADARHLLGQHNDPRIGYQRLAIALHFMADCACPFHTCLINPWAQKYHRIYEEYVARNMLRGHAFRDALAETPHNWIHPEHTRDLVRGAGIVAERAGDNLGTIIGRIRSCGSWDRRKDVASVTTDLLIGALRMCETQIYSVISAVPENRPSLHTSGSFPSYRNPLGAFPFYRTHVLALLRQS